jgi:hypothetical protein
MVTAAPLLLLLLQATVRDLYLAKDLGTFTSGFTGLVMPRDVLPLRITPTGPPAAGGAVRGSLPATSEMILSAAAAGPDSGLGDDGWRPWYKNEYIQRHARRRRSGAEVEAAMRANRAARMRKAVGGAAASVYY